MRWSRAALAALWLVTTVPAAAQSEAADFSAITQLAQDGTPGATTSAWGPFLALGGREWGGHAAKSRFNWIDPGRVLAWQRYAIFGGWWDVVVLTAEGGTIQADAPPEYATGTMTLGLAGEAVITLSNGSVRTVAAEGGSFRVRGIREGRVLDDYALTPVDSEWTQTAAIEAAEATVNPRQPVDAPRSGPIILAAGPSSSPQVSRSPAPTVPAFANTARAPSGGPIVLATAPPPPAAIRQAPTPAAGTSAVRSIAPTSREALMAAQVATQREQAARAAEAERLRQAQIAEDARVAEANRQAQAAANASSRNEMFGFIGAVLGGVVVGSQTGGSMEGISAGMAMGSTMAAPGSDAAVAAQQMAQVEAERAEAERAHWAAVIAEVNNPNNPLTQESRRREEERNAASEAERTRIETEYNAKREEDEAQALLQERMAEAEQTQDRQAEDRAQNEARAAAREEQQRRAEAQREREAEQARAEQERRQEEQRQRQQLADREAEARRQEQERQRAAAEAERTRLIDFKEAVVLCSLTGPQAQFNNWTCEGPLQMNYVDFEQPNWVGALALTDCSSPRELPRAGPYRAFGCGYGIHPTNPGNGRDVPAMLGVFVAGRATFRCPRNITVACRDR